MSLQARYEILKGEQLKAAAEATLERLGASDQGTAFLERYAFGPEGRPDDSRLHTDIAGIRLDNPVMTGAGWDKKGRAVSGLAALGFSGVEVGTVLPFAQAGNPRPRLWTIDDAHAVGMNRLGFNSPGATAVAETLSTLRKPCVIGINVGSNKELVGDVERVVMAHDIAMRRLLPFADYISLGISSPNTEGLRSLQAKESLQQIISGAFATMRDENIRVPLFAKVDGDRSEAEVEATVEVALEEGLDGFIAANTTNNTKIKGKYGVRWGQEMGGLSGDDPDYRRLATQTVERIYRRSEGDLTIIGVGGVNNGETALEKIKAGASAVQVVTAIRPSYGTVAATINQELRARMDADGVDSIRDYIGSAVV